MSAEVEYLRLGPADFRARLAAAPVAYLPLGTLEWHGEHLPLGADALQAQGLFIRLAREVGGIVLPPLFLGPDGSRTVDGRQLVGMEIRAGLGPGGERQLDGSAYWVPEELYLAMVEGALAQLARAGFRVVVAHGHGPSTNHFQRRVPEWESRFGLRLFTCWRENEHELTDGLGMMIDHAAANETSLTMALFPDLVHMERLPADPAVKPLAVAGDDPRVHASAERGERIVRLQAERMAGLVRAALAGAGAARGKDAQ